MCSLMIRMRSGPGSRYQSRCFQNGYTNRYFRSLVRSSRRSSSEYSDSLVIARYE